MNRAFRAVSSGLVVALLVTVAMAFAPGGRREAKAALGPLQAVTLTGADFHPWSHTVTYTNGGDWLIGAGGFYARIPFPAEVVMITTVKAWAYDNAGGVDEDLCVSVVRAAPANAAGTYLGTGCTAWMSAEDPQTLSLSVFTRVGGHHAAYLVGNFPDVSVGNLSLYGATVFYRVVS